MRRNLTVCNMRREWGAMHRLRTAYVPSIRINGNWLADAGFTPGQRVSVSIKQVGCPSQPALVIQPEGSAI